MPQMSCAFRKCGEDEFYSSFSHSEYAQASVSSFFNSELPMDIYQRKSNTKEDTKVLSISISDR